MLGYVEYNDTVYPYTENDENGYKIITGLGKFSWVGERLCKEVDIDNQPNPILENVKGLIDKQTEKGLIKYGETVNPDSYTMLGWLEHLQQELVDALVYTETLKAKIKKVIG